jgi:TrpR family trp operon transcriptional repressor
MEELLEDFLTPAEAQDLVERWKIVSELLAEKTQREIRDQLGVSIAKVSRGSRIVQYGSGAFRRSKNRI